MEGPSAYNNYKTQKILYTPRIGLFDASGLKKKIDLRTEN